MISARIGKLHGRERIVRCSQRLAMLLIVLRPRVVVLTDGAISAGANESGARALRTMAPVYPIEVSGVVSVRRIAHRLSSIWLR